MEVKFFKGTGTPTTIVDGGVYFRTDTKIISLGVGSNLVDFGGNLTDASYDETKKLLTINKSDGTKIELSFADFASATAMAEALAERLMTISGENAIVVTDTTEENAAGKSAKISLKLDNSGNVQLSQGADGLKAEVDIPSVTIPVKDVQGKNDIKVTSADGVFTAETALDADITVMGVTLGALANGGTLKKGMTFSEVLKKILIKEIDVTATKPTTTIKVTGVTLNNAYEVGTAVSVTLAHTYTDGKFTGQSGYSYTLAAGCAEGETTYKRNNNVVTSPDAFTVTEGTHTWNCTTAYGASTASPKKNNGTASSVNIAAGTAASGNFSINGKYKAYIGYSTETDGSAFDSAKIKALSAGNVLLSTSGSTTLKSSATSNGTSIVIACPATFKLNTIENSLGVSIKENFAAPVQVDYTNGSTTTKYNVYVYPITSGAEIAYKNVTISK